MEQQILQLASKGQEPYRLKNDYANYLATQEPIIRWSRIRPTPHKSGSDLQRRSEALEGEKAKLQE